MRYRLTGGWTAATLAVVAALAGPALGQGPGVGTYAYPGLPSDTRIPNPLPTGDPSGHGFYTYGEFLMLTQTWTLGDQAVAVRGLVDSRGLVTGVPGTRIGSGMIALSTDMFPRRTWMPGFTVGAGYKFDEGTSIYASYTHLLERDYHTGATLVPPFFRSSPDLSDTFLTSGVYNFPPQYAGPLVKTTADDVNGNGTADPGEGGNFYGIWNGSSVQDIQFNQWYNAAEIGARTPLFQTEYSRIYGSAGGRYNNFMERFLWRTVSYDISGQAGPRDAAIYNNTLSQRMYGIFVGCGHEAYLGGGFSTAVDVSAAGLLNVVKERAKYKLQSLEIQNKLARDELTFVPSFTGNFNLLWHPIEGVQLRVGYSAYTFFNTLDMHQPIGFNYSAIDPAYDIRAFRIIHGVNVGVGLFF